MNWFSIIGLILGIAAFLGTITATFEHTLDPGTMFFLGMTAAVGIIFAIAGNKQ